MIIVSVALFLRFDECCNLEYAHFEQELFTVMNNNVQTLAVYIKGKTDVKRNLLSISQNKEFFDLCPVSTLLLYIGKNFRTDSTYLFPGKKTPKYNMVSFDKEVKFLLENVLHKTPTRNSLFGTHVWRKTAYAVALCGK